MLGWVAGDGVGGDDDVEVLVDRLRGDHGDGDVDGDAGDDDRADAEVAQHLERLGAVRGGEPAVAGKDEIVRTDPDLRDRLGGGVTGDPVGEHVTEAGEQGGRG